MYQTIPEDPVPGKPLGRHINHDPKSRLYPHVPRLTAVTPVSKKWPRFIQVLDQGNLGSCTGNAETGALGTQPLYSTLSTTQQQTIDSEAFAVKLYGIATGLDPYDGTYPPDDTGSDGLSVCKAAKSLKFISGYTHGFSMQALIDALQSQAVIIGINWYSGSDDPDADGYCHASGSVRGGHELCADEVNVEEQYIGFTNSWGRTWGQNGRARFKYADMEKLLSEDGDVTVSVPLTAPAPTPVVDMTADEAFALKLHEWLGKNRYFYKDVQSAARTWLSKRGL